MSCVRVRVMCWHDQVGRAPPQRLSTENGCSEYILQYVEGYRKRTRAGGIEKERERAEGDEKVVAESRGGGVYIYTAVNMINSILSLCIAETLLCSGCMYSAWYTLKETDSERGREREGELPQVRSVDVVPCACAVQKIFVQYTCAALRVAVCALVCLHMRLCVCTFAFMYVPNGFRSRRAGSSAI